MPDAAIVSYARTPIGKAFRGALNLTHGATLGAHVLRHAVQRAGIDPGEVDDVVQCAMADPAADCVLLGLLAIGGPSYDVDRFARDCSAAVRASGKPLWVYSPHPRVRQAFGEQGLPVFAGEAEALREIAGHAEHLGALGLPLASNPQPETLHA